MEIYELYRLLELPAEVIEKLDYVSEKTDIAKTGLYIEQMTHMETAAKAYKYLKALFKEDEDNIKMLYCQLEGARQAYDKYEEKHIPRDIYISTMKCFTRFLNECKEINGRMFFDRGWWTYRQVSMSIFRIGELEYEFNEYEGENTVSIHIPSDADLSKDAVDYSLKSADKFFKEYYDGYKYKKYTCFSWLLSPQLKPLLSESSNIKAFQERFDIIRENKEDKEYIEWLFQAPVNTDYIKLPEKTSLQRRVKELLLNGGAVGMAYGIMKDYNNCLQ